LQLGLDEYKSIKSTLIMTENCSSQSFYPLTVSTLDQLYQADLSPSELRLWLYLSALDPWGDRYEELPDTLELMEKVGIKKSTFYAAIAKFQELNLFDFQVRGVTFRNLMGAQKVWKGFQPSGKVSKNLESIPDFWNSVQEFGTNSSDSENQPARTLTLARVPVLLRLIRLFRLIHTLKRGARA
jgi:hypothetical protein